MSQTAKLLRRSIFAELAGRLEAQARRGTDLVGLHLGDSYRTPPEAARFARLEGEEPPDARKRPEAAISQGLTESDLYTYGSVAGMPELKRAFAARLAETGHGPREVDASRHVLIGCGATHALFCALRAILDPGDEVIVAAPYWPLSVGVVRAAGGVPVEVPLTTPYRDAVDIGDRLDRARTARTRAIYFATPNNPDGRVMRQAELEAIAAVARAGRLWVVSDEVYADYVYEGAHASIGRLAEMGDRSISIYSLSKSHALAGVRIGFAICPDAVLDIARRTSIHTLFNVPVASQRVALAALGAPAAWLMEARADYCGARDETVRALKELTADVFAPQGGSYVFVDFAPVLRGKPLRSLLEHAIDHGVLVAPGDGFGAGYESWARVCFTATPRARLRKGLERLAEAARSFN
jgi:aspartate/methionine/tyrosine aminotransferase